MSSSSSSSSASSSSSSSASSSVASSVGWEPPTFTKKPWNTPSAELKKLGYRQGLSDASNCFRPWYPGRFEGYSKLYKEVWEKWSEDVRRAQFLASDGMPYNDNPAPAIADSGYICENQDMTSYDLQGRVFGRSHSIVFGHKTIIMDSTSHQMEIAEPVDTWPRHRQRIMEDVAHNNYYDEDGCEDWSYAATVVSSSARGDTFMSPIHTNPLKPGHKDPGLVHWISARGSIVDDLATTKVQMEKITIFGSKVIAARHGTMAPGPDGPSQLILLGEHFNSGMLQMLDKMKNSYSASDIVIRDSLHRVKFPRLFRLIVVNANGFTKEMATRLFGKDNIFEGRVPVRQFTDCTNPGKEIEVVVFPVTFSSFWEDQAYSYYVHNQDEICAAYREKLRSNIHTLMRKRYANEDLKQFVGSIYDLISEAEPASAAASDFTDLCSRVTALQRNVLQKSDLKKCGETTAPAKLFEVGPCANRSCSYAGPAGFGCVCGDVFTTHVRRIPTERFRFANEFLDSSSEESASEESASEESASEESASEDDASDEEDDASDEEDDLAAKKVNAKKRKSATSAGNSAKKSRNGAVEQLKKAYKNKYGNLPKGRFASNTEWLKKKVD